MTHVKGFSVILLAAGQGTRMKSPLPKVLHPVAGIPMIHRVIHAVQEAGAREVRVVVGFGEHLIRQVIEPLGVTCFRQTEQKGTADAVRSAMPETLSDDVLILNGDHPLLKFEDIRLFMREFAASGASVGVASARIEKPGNYGRIVRHKGDIRAIVEAGDASAETLKIDEVNTGIYAIRAGVLEKYLPKIKNHNSKGEFYLTDIISLCQEASEKVTAIVCPSHVAAGVNNQRELAEATKHIFRQKANSLMDEGVMILDPDHVYIEESVKVGSATVIYPNVTIRGKTSIGKFCVFESNCFISDSQFEDSVQVRAGSYIEKTIMRTKSDAGPYARLRPETEIGAEAHVGNFVEMKKVKFGAGAKAGHLTYLGDAEVGEKTNIGCGTITCNYAADRKKYRTVIGKNVFVGSDSQFVAPVTIGDNAVIGSGSTITKDVPAEALAVARSKQFVKENYKPKKDK